MPHQILSNQVYAATEVDIWRQPLIKTTRSMTTDDGGCAPNNAILDHLLTRARVSPVGPQGTLTMICVYNPPSAAICDI